MGSAAGPDGGVVVTFSRLFCLLFGHSYVIDGLRIRCHFCKDSR